MPCRKQSRLPSRAKVGRSQVEQEVVEVEVEHEQRQEKLRLLLADYDHEVKQRVQMMEDEIETILQFIGQIYRTDLMRYSASAREQPWREDSSNKNTKAMRQTMVGLLSSADNAIQSTTKKRGRPTKAMLAAMADAAQLVPPSASRGTRSSSRSRTVLGASQTDNMGPPPTTIRAPRSRKVDVEATPCNQGISASYQNSLFVTPKFDPRTPLPPGTVKRHPKIGEIAMSLKGSPLQVSPPTKVGTDGWVESLDVQNMDEETKEQLLKLHEKVGKMLNI